MRLSSFQIVWKRKKIPPSYFKVLQIKIKFCRYCSSLALSPPPGGKSTDIVCHDQLGFYSHFTLCLVSNFMSQSCCLN